METDRNRTEKRKISRHAVLAWILIAALVLVTGTVLLCRVPFVTRYEKVFPAYEIWYDGETDTVAESAPAKVILSGKLYRYLTKPDEFVGHITVEGFEMMWDAPAILKLTPESYGDTIRFTPGIGEVVLSSLSTERSPYLYLGRGEQEIHHLHSQLIGDGIFLQLVISGGGGKTDGMIIAPASTEEEAAALYREKLLSVWQAAAAEALAAQTETEE